MNLSLILWLALGSETEANVIKAEHWKRLVHWGLPSLLLLETLPQPREQAFPRISNWQDRGSSHSSCLTASGLKTQMRKWGQPTPSNSSQAGPEWINLPNQLRELWEILNGCCFRLLSLGMTYSEKVNWHRSLGIKMVLKAMGMGWSYYGFMDPALRLLTQTLSQGSFHWLKPFWKFI